MQCNWKSDRSSKNKMLCMEMDMEVGEKGNKANPSSNIHRQRSNRPNTNSSKHQIVRHLDNAIYELGETIQHYERKTN